MSHFIQKDEQLLIIADTGTVEWKGQPSGWPIAKVIQFNESQTAILLLRYFKWEKTRGINLMCINSKAEIIWQAAEKNNNFFDDVIVDVLSEKNSFFVTTWNGWSLQLDVKTGILSRMNFTK